MELSQKRYLESTLPTYISEQLDLMVDRLKSVDRKSWSKYCMDMFGEVKEFGHQLCKKLKSLESQYAFSIVIEKYIITMREVSKAHQVKVEEPYLLVWLLSNLNTSELYEIQIFLRLICINTQCESKKHFDTVKVDYKSKYDNDIDKAYLMLQTQSQLDDAIDVEEIFLEIFKRMPSKSLIFIKYLAKWAKEHEFPKCTVFLKEKQSSIRKKLSEVVSNKRSGFEQFKQDSRVEPKECSNSVFDELQTDNMKYGQSIRDRRLSLMMQNNPRHRSVEQRLDLNSVNSLQEGFRELREFRELPKLKENAKTINTETVRPSVPLTRRTINSTMNPKYKVNVDEKRRVVSKQGVNSGKKKASQQLSQAEQVQGYKQLQFCKEVALKLEEHSRRPRTCWNSEVIEPDTPSNENSCFN